MNMNFQLPLVLLFAVFFVGCIDIIDENSAPVAYSTTDINDPLTYDLTFVGTDLQIFLHTTDADNDSLTYIITPPTFGVLSGTPPQMTYRAGIVGLDSFSFRVNDGTVDSNEVSIGIRTVDLAEMMVESRANNEAYLAGQYSNEIKTKIRDIDDLIYQAQLTYVHQYIGNTLLLLEEVSTLMLNTSLLEVIPEFRTNLHLLTFATYGDVNLQYETLEIEGYNKETALVNLNNALSQYHTDDMDPSVLALLKNVFFYIQDPHSITDSINTIQHITEELALYISYGDLPATEELANLKQTIAENILWRLEDLQDLGYLSEASYLQLILDLQETITELSTVEEKGVWVRNWQWEITQVIRFMIRGFNEEASSVIGIDNALILEVQEKINRGEAFIENRDVDAMVDIYTDSSMQCTLLWIYKDAQYTSPYPPEDYGCSR